MKRMRDELSELRQEEIDLEQKVDASRSQVSQLDQRLVDTQTQISQVCAPCVILHHVIFCIVNFSECHCPNEVKHTGLRQYW